MAKTIIVFVLSLFALSCMANTRDYLQNELQPLWSSWKIYHGKAYSGHGEESARFAIFVENYKKVVAFNDQSEDAKLGLNNFADLTEEEFKEMYTGFNQEDHELEFQENDEFGFLENRPSTELASSVDWRTQGAVTPVDNQGSCGSCWAFSAAEALEGLYKIKKGSLLKFSKQQLMDCSSSYGNQGCNGGLMDYAFKYTQAKGVETETNYPYKAAVGVCRYDTSKAVFKNTGYKQVTKNSYTALKAAVAQQPVSVAVQATGTIQLYKSGIITSNCGTALDHGVLAVGYGSSGSTDYWIVKNSWGTSWGELGYFRVKMGAENAGAGVCGINSAASYPTL